MKRADKKVDPEKVFRALLEQEGIPQPESEYVFAPPRKWRFDYAWLAARVALEVEGAVWVQGRHTRGSGFLKDMQKYSEAAILGWCVLKTTPSQLCSRETIELVARALSTRHSRAPGVEGPGTTPTPAVVHVSPPTSESSAVAIQKKPARRSASGPQRIRRE